MRRRLFITRLGRGILLVGASVVTAYTFIKSLFPRVYYGREKKIKAGKPHDFVEGINFLEKERIFILRKGNSFGAMSAVCTHLGCTVNMVYLHEPRKRKIKGRVVEENYEFSCPCHGSRYYADGKNYAGPAPRPLKWFDIFLSPDGYIVVNTSKEVERDTFIEIA